MEGAIKELKSSFEKKGYQVHHIKLSDDFSAIAEVVGYEGLNSDTRYERVTTYIEFGDNIRERMGNEFLGAFAMSKVASKRLENSNSDVFQKNIYIIDQLKTEAEITLLREVYGLCFFQISIYSARDVRVDYLSRIMARDDKKRDRNAYRDKAERLVVIDEDEFDKPHGQKVGKIFQLADVVLNVDRVDEKDNIRAQVRRFVDLLFGHNGYSPNRLEYGMYLAHSAALRSLDLSRQVGAAIFRASGEVASLGANEVPKATGGTYWADDEHDAREYKIRNDSNDLRKQELLNEVLEIALGKNPKLSDNQKKDLKNSQFMDALEYGRIVHAEMSALSDAARLGISVKDGVLYCTTFPCHMCSKHIVASGIAKVIFLEPYPKSLTLDMHSDSVKIEGSSRDGFEKFQAVEFTPFFGITPRRYREFFARGKRKLNGVFEDFQTTPPRPFISIMAPWYSQRETEIIKMLGVKLGQFRQVAPEIIRQGGDL